MDGWVSESLSNTFCAAPTARVNNAAAEEIRKDLDGLLSAISVPVTPPLNKQYRKR